MEFIKNVPVKLEINGHIDPCFGYIREVNLDTIVIEHHDCVDVVDILEITNLIY